MKVVRRPNQPNENNYIAVIDDGGIIQFANETLNKCLHIDPTNQYHRQFFNFLSATGNTELKKALQMAGDASHPCRLRMDLLNSSVHKANWLIVRLQPINERPALFICIGNETDSEKPTNTNSVFTGTPLPAPGIIIQNANAQVIDANSKAVTLLNTCSKSLHEHHPNSGTASPLQTITQWVSCDNYPPMKALLSGQSQQQVVAVPGSPQRNKLLVTSYPLFDDKASVPFSIITIIKELAPGEAQPQSDDELLTIALKNNTAAMHWLIDAKTENLILGNPAFLRFTNLTTAAFHKNAREVIPTLYHDVLAPKHREVALTGIEHKKIYRLPLADGTTSYFLIRVFPVPNSHDKQLVGGEAVDITFGYDVHEEIARANERLIHLNQVTGDAIWEWNLKNNHIYRNDQLKILVGDHSHEEPSMPWWMSHIHPDDLPHYNANVKHVLDNKLPSWNQEYRFMFGDGEYRPIRDRGVLIYEEGKPVKAIGSILDLSEIKELESQLVQEKINHQKAITKSIIDTQEKVSTKIGQELHDNINQLLLVTKLYVNLLKQPESYNTEEIMDKIQESLNIAIHDIKTMSRQMVLPKLADKTLHESITKLVNDIKTICPFDIQLICRGQYDEHISEGKKVALYRIAQEQLKNIIQYSQAKSVFIIIKSCPGYIELSINDDGVGFDPFKKSQGIGLRNIYDRTELYNGQVELQSAPGEGCSLTVRIPRCQ